MFVLVAEIDLRMPQSQSLKEKRSIVQSIVRNLDQMHGVGAAEVDFHDDHQRVLIGSTAVGDSVSHVESVVDSVERYVWSRTEIEVLEIQRSWWEND